MNSLRSTGTLAVALLVFFLSAQADPAAGGKRKKGADEVYPAVGGAAQTQLCNGNYCLEVWAFLTGPFFETLEVRGALASPVFLQSSQPVEFFPEQIRLLILATEDSRPYVTADVLEESLTRVPAFIPPPQASRQESDIPLTHDTMMNVWFKAEWKHNGKHRRVDNLTWEEGYKVWRGLAPAEWYYTLTFSAHEVPLTDHLLVTVFDDNGRKLASLEASVPLGVLPFVQPDKKRD